MTFSVPLLGAALGAVLKAAGALALGAGLVGRLGLGRRGGEGGEGGGGGGGGRPLGVRHEWDRLREAIVGTAEGLTIPGYHQACVYSDDPAYLELCRRHGGRPAREVEPELTARVAEEMDRLARVLAHLGVKVHRPRRLGAVQLRYRGYLQQGAMFLFPRDPLLVIGRNVIETALRLPMRAKERFALRPVVIDRLQHSGINYLSMPPAEPGYPPDGIYLEGGDVLLDGREVYVGVSGRASNPAGVAWLRRFLGPDYRVHLVELVAEVVHLDLVMALVRPGLGVLYRPGLAGELPEPLREWEWLELRDEEARALAANLLVLDRRRVILEASQQRLAGELRRRGVKVVELPFQAVAHWGGGLRCAHQPLLRRG